VNVVTKAVAVIEDVPDSQETDPNGEFDVILSAQTLDRDGDTLLGDEWKQPLPDHITFDIDHGMSVASTVGSGRPFINNAGNLQVRGTYSSIPRAQEVRTLVREGHIRTTSVAFMTVKSEQKDAKPVRELLNGAFVAIPSNREAVVLSAKALQVVEKVGARNSASDAAAIQDIHNAAKALGADCGDGAADGANKSARKALEAPVADEDTDEDPAALASACDAALDQALALVADVDTESLPPEVAQALALMQAADESIDGLLSLLGIPDPDEDSDEDEPAAAADDAAQKAASDAAAADIALRGRALLLQVDSAALLD
jgi:hypothetical protein